MERKLSGMTFGDGTRTIKFDKVGSAELINATFNNQETLIELEDRMDRHEKTEEANREIVLKLVLSSMNCTAETCKALAGTISVMESVNHNSHAMHAQTMELLLPLLSGRLFRFLNFFGRWFIYGADGSIHRNCPENEIYGKAPFLTRLFRRLHR